MVATFVKHGMLYLIQAFVFLADKKILFHSKQGAANKPGKLPRTKSKIQERAKEKQLN